MVPFNIPETRIVFLEALQYPQYARPDFFLREQKKTGWSERVFLRALHHDYQSLREKLLLTERHEQEKKARSNSPQPLPTPFSLDLKTESKGAFTGTITKGDLIDLEYAITLAWKSLIPEKKHTPYEILSFSERSLLFIQTQFEKQVQKTYAAPLFAEKQRAKGIQIDGDPEYLLNHYSVIAPAPFLNYFLIRNEIRYLLLNNHGREELSIILKPQLDLAIKLVNFWNEQLQPLEEPELNKTKVRAMRELITIELEEEDMSIGYKTEIEENKHILNSGKHFWNKDLAVFASRFANLVAGEIMKNNKSTYDLQSKYSDLDDLFVDPGLNRSCYQILIDADLIDANLIFKGKHKNAIVFWTRKLQAGSKPILNHCADLLLSVLLNKKFPGLEMEASLLRKPYKAAINKFGDDFTFAIGKLSQPAPKGKL